MTTNQDILSFLRVDKESREKEKEQEKLSRAKERDEDMAKIADMIRSGVREEVDSAIQPVTDRLIVQEKVTEGLGNQITTLMREMETLKKHQDSSIKSQSEPTGVSSAAADCELVVVNSSDRDGDHNRRVLDICEKARRIIGFTPIEPRMLEIQIESYGAKNMEEAMLMEVKSYWKCEMKVKPTEIEKIQIVRIFPPAKENWNTLYVEFGSEYDVDKMFGFTKVMTKEHRVVRWYPKEMYDRFEALDKITYNMREDMKAKGVKLKTRVRVIRNDLELSTKMPDSNWRVQPLPNGLPRIDLDIGTKHTMTSSPPPGRPGRAEMLAQAIEGVLANDKAIEAAEAEKSRREDDRKRQHSDSDREEVVKRSKGSPQSNNIYPDLSKIQQSESENQNVADVGNSSIVEGDLLGHVERDQVGLAEGGLVEHAEGTSQTVMGVDPGKFINEEAYCPSSPARAKIIPDLSVILNSPVYHSKVAKNLK